MAPRELDDEEAPARRERDLLAACAKAGMVRDDVPPAELASYCLHALSAAAAMPSKAALKRLVDVTLAGVRHRSSGV